MVLLDASPAWATGGMTCRTAGPRSVEVVVVIGHTALSTVASAQLMENGRRVPVTVAQSWLEPDELRLDLMDRNALRHELRLRVKRSGFTYDGSLWRNGKRRWIRCRES